MTTFSKSSVPRLFRRENGGWLAVSPSGRSLQIGVVADTEGEALALYARREAAWKELLNARQREQA